MRALTSWLGRIGPVPATGVLIGVAVLLAELAHQVFAYVWGAGATIEVAFVTIVVAAPIIVYAQFVIRKLGESRRALRQLIKQLALAVESAQQANQAKSQFIASMSHELRTPLNAIIGFAEIIERERFGPVGNARYLGYVRDIGQSGHHLLCIINDILSLSKIEAGHAATQDEEEFKLDAVIDATMRMMRPLSERAHVALEPPREPSGVRLLAVERMVCQVLLNLLSNAVKFTPEGGQVALTTARTAEGGLRISVADTGVGMTAHDIGVALTPFGQVDNRQNRKHSGTGLGLPLAKAMMEVHGGSLQIASAPGQGTTVSIVFPRERVITPTASGSVPPAERPTCRLPGEAAKLDLLTAPLARNAA
jgi:signal transduction histidine kinase